MTATHFREQSVDEPMGPLARRRWSRPALAATLFLVFLVYLGRIAREQWYRQVSTEVAGLAVDTRVLDFGSVAPGSQVEGVFHLRNQSSKDLQILGTVADCGCMAAPLPQQTLRPSGTLDLPVKFMVPVDSEPAMSRRLVVRVKDRDREARVVLRMVVRLDIASAFVALPGRADLGTAGVGKRVSKPIHVRDHSPL